VDLLKWLQVVLLILIGVAVALVALISLLSGETSNVATALAVFGVYGGVVSLLLFRDANAWPLRLLPLVWQLIASTRSRAAISAGILSLLVICLAFVTSQMRYETLQGVVNFPPDDSSSRETVVVTVKTSANDAGKTVSTAGFFVIPVLRRESVWASAESEHHHTSGWVPIPSAQLFSLELHRKTSARTMPAPDLPTSLSPTSASSEVPRQTLQWKSVHGNWNFADRSATQADEDAHPGLATISATGTATELTLDARRISGTDGFSVILSYERENQAAWWDIGGYGGVKSIAEFSLPDRGVYFVPETDRPFMIKTGEWYAIHLGRMGRHVLGTVNGALLLDFNIPENIASNGLLGFRTWSSKMEFRNVSIR
jgi:hypothetical protein